MASQTTNCPFCSIEISSHFYANHLNYCSKIHGCSITKVSSKENSKLQRCPSCQKNFTTAEFTSHLVSCVKKKSQEKVEFQENSYLQNLAFQSSCTCTCHVHPFWSCTFRPLLVHKLPLSLDPKLGPFSRPKLSPKWTTFSCCECWFWLKHCKN